MDYGKFDQRFPVDSTHQIILGDEIERLHRVILDSKRVIISGNPGSGKSWLVDEYVDKLTSEDSKVISKNGLLIHMNNTVDPMLLKILMEAIKEPVC